MKQITLFILISALFFTCNQNDNQTLENGEQETVLTEDLKDGVFIHISEGYNDPHRVLMPLKMAVMMAEDKDVLVYMDIKAVELCVAEAEDLSYESFESFSFYVDELKKAGVGIYACPSCLEVAGLKDKELKSGIEIAAKNKFFNFTKGRIITLDY
jgi:predicted peroxiredoxin